MKYKVLYPSEKLAAIVDSYWYVASDYEPIRMQYFDTPILQTLAFNLKKNPDIHRFGDRIFHLTEAAYFFGQSISPREITTNGNGFELINVKLKDTGMYRLTGIPMVEMVNNIIPATSIWKDTASLVAKMEKAETFESYVSILEEFLIPRILKRKEYTLETVEKAMTLIIQSGGTIDMNELQTQVNTSRKTLERAFYLFVGISPKLYARIIQFNEAKELMKREPGLSISDIAYQTGYYDNSHLALAFKSFSWHTPVSYLKLMQGNPVKYGYYKEY